MVRIDQCKFDENIKFLVQDCPHINEANCNTCPTMCILYRGLKNQGILVDEIPDIMNTLRLLFLDEIATRISAMKKCPRYEELLPSEYMEVMSSSKYFKYDISDELFAIF